MKDIADGLFYVAQLDGKTFGCLGLKKFENNSGKSITECKHKQNKNIPFPQKHGKKKPALFPTQDFFTEEV